jgi:hypothetical protein
MKAELTQNESVRAVLTAIYKTKLPGAVSKKVLATVSSFDLASSQFLAMKAEVYTKNLERDAEGNPLINDGKITIPEANKEAFIQEYNALLEKELEVTPLSSADLDLLPELSGEDLKLLTDAGLVA